MMLGSKSCTFLARSNQTGNPMISVLGWPGRWHGDHLYDDGGLPLHLYPMPVNIRGEGPLDDSDTDVFRMVCWCHLEGCMGSEDALGFPAQSTNL